MKAKMKCGAIALIAAPVFSLIFFGLEPGGLVIDNVDADNLADEMRLKIEALSSNAFMTHLSAFVVPLSLAFGLFGMWVVENDARGRGEGSAIWSAGLVLLAITFTGWVISQSLNHQIANTGLDSGPSQATANALYAVDVSITQLFGVFAGLGFLFYSLGAAAAERANKWASWIVAAFSVVSLAAMLVGTFEPELFQPMRNIVWAIYIVWSAWLVYLGVRTFRSG